MTEKSFIEFSFPVKEVSLESAKEKNIRHGHISTLHIWWARRPLASSRATSYAALIPAPESPEEWEKKRQFIIKFSKWENSLNHTFIEQAREEILEANGGKPPKVLDPFAGGGSIPLEALCLGCETYANDYNPVAALILRCTLEYPQKYGKPGEIKRKIESKGLKLPNTVEEKSEVKNVLLEDVKYWGEWVLEEAKKEIGKFYPEDPDGSIPVGYIWARTIPCQNPLCGAEIPLMRQFWLARKSNKKIALKPIIRNKKVDFEIIGQGTPFPEDFDPEKGTVARAFAKCPVCGATVDDKTTRRLFQEEKAGQRMVAVVLQNHNEQGKTYRLATDNDMEIFRESEKYLKEKREKLMMELGMDPVPDETMNTKDPNTVAGRGYGITKWGDLFNSRQKLALITFVEKVKKAHEKMIGEKMDEVYAKAVVSYLGFVVSRLADANSELCHWDGSWEKTATTFARQALPMTWDYIEANVFGEKGYTFESILNTISLVLSNISKASKQVGSVIQCSATELPYPDNYFDAVFTDPPYYDNINYAELSDFFYVWLKRTIGDLYPDLFSTPLVPKSKEIVANPVRQGGQDKAKEFFESMLKKSFQEIYRVLKPNGIATIVYAHKSTSGWETLINSLLDSEIVVTASWPIDTEMKEKLNAHGTASLMSSIYMVARKAERVETGWFNEVKEEIKKYLNEKLERLWKEGVAGSDFFIAAIGSAIEVFGKYKKVMDYDGQIVRADKMLEYVREIVTDYAVHQILHNGFAGEISPLTRFYLLWRWTYREAKVEFDDARKLAQTTGIALEKEWNKGFIKKDKEFIIVLGPQDRDIKELEESKELIDVLHYALILWKEAKKDDMKNILSNSGFGKNDIFYRVAQAISETLPKENKEKQLLDGFLAGKEKLISEINDVEKNKKVNEELKFGE